MSVYPSLKNQGEGKKRSTRQKTQKTQSEKNVPETDHLWIGTKAICPNKSQP